MLAKDESKIKQCLVRYQNPDVTRREILSVLNHYNGLAAHLEPYVFNDGTKMDLVNLAGTIPVMYKGASYNIPVCIWLVNTHPFNPPICYVKPTADMQIKISRYVDYNGKIYLPYLHDWTPNASDLLSLIQVMIVTFGEQPPVYAKSRNEPSSMPPYPATSYMPMPPTSTSSYLPYPPSGGYNPPTTSYGGSGPYPPYPTQPPANTNFPSYSMYGNAYPSHYPSYPAGQSPPLSGNATTGTGTITEEHIRASLLSAVEDKLKRRLREQFMQNQAELDTLRRTQQELTQGKAKLEDILQRLDTEQAELDKNLQILQEKEKELETAIEKISTEEFNVEDAVTTTTPLYKQLLNAFAEEAATEDAIYYMDEALRRGVIDLDVFLKQVRTLSHKQFMLRALMQKCRQKAGLAG
ncbi:tumor susceptibility gene 101 protein [Chrysoperla carnea]|uniref:tumor susceptibility gene 101 protein n=1 Tax=Chrysoperla carnea TaxID=189513 RepID=UPI001D066297|nr:tumor susceptibility gene 101 protein [Chrysoperla carnea]